MTYTVWLFRVQLFVNYLRVSCLGQKGNKTDGALANCLVLPDLKDNSKASPSCMNMTSIAVMALFGQQGLYLAIQIYEAWIAREKISCFCREYTKLSADECGILVTFTFTGERNQKAEWQSFILWSLWKVTDNRLMDYKHLLTANR